MNEFEKIAEQAFYDEMSKIAERMAPGVIGGPKFSTPEPKPIPEPKGIPTPKIDSTAGKTDFQKAQDNELGKIKGGSGK